MVSQRIIAGGEEAGGIGVQDYIPERDGTLAGLLILEKMVYEKKNLKRLLEDMEKEFGRYYYLRGEAKLGSRKVDIAAIRNQTTILGKAVVDVKDYDGIKWTMQDESWLMLRPSGTEPLLRIYAEGRNQAQVKNVLAVGKKIGREVVGR